MGNAVKLHMDQFTALRRSEPIQAEVNQVADRIAARANSMGTENHAGVPIYRAEPAIPTDEGIVALVSTKESLAATIDTTHHNTLLKALGG